MSQVFAQRRGGRQAQACTQRKCKITMVGSARPRPHGQLIGYVTVMTGSDRIPVAEPDLSGNEAEYALRAIRSSWIGPTGEFVTRFEQEFAATCGTAEAITVSNGTVALHLAMLALGIGPGDEVIVPSLTYVATANAVRYVGAEPVFVDVSPDVWCLDPAQLAGALTERTRAIVPVHLYGHPADMEPIIAFARAHGLHVVEDAAEAPLATYRGRVVGSMGDIATFSFFGNKVLTSGEGGAVTLSDPELAARARLLRGQGMDPERRYYFPVVGHNFRLTNVACALLCAQLERAAEMLATRRRLVASYRDLLDGVPGIEPQAVAPWAVPTPWLFSVTIDRAAYGRDRDELAKALAERGIETRPFFIPVHTLPPYVDAACARGAALPVTDDVAARGLNLPTASSFTVEHVRVVAGAIADLAS